jgi:hypothetical protein
MRRWAFVLLIAACGGDDEAVDVEPLNECSAIDSIVRLQDIHAAVLAADTDRVTAASLALHGDVDVFDLANRCPPTLLTTFDDVAATCGANICELAITSSRDGEMWISFAGTITLDGDSLMLSLRQKQGPQVALDISTSGTVVMSPRIAGELSYNPEYTGTRTSVMLDEVAVDANRCPVGGSLHAKKTFPAAADPDDIPPQVGDVDFGPTCR